MEGGTPVTGGSILPGLGGRRCLLQSLRPSSCPSGDRPQLTTAPLRPSPGIGQGSSQLRNQCVLLSLCLGLVPDSSVRRSPGCRMDGLQAAGWKRGLRLLAWGCGLDT